MEESEIREILNFVKSLFPNNKIGVTNKIVNDWHEMLGNYEKVAIKNAIKSIASKETYPPNIPQILLELKTLNAPFDVRRIERDGEYHIWIRFKNLQETLPFIFYNKAEANKLINHLKDTKPDIEELRMLHQEMQIAKNVNQLKRYEKNIKDIVTEEERKSYWRKRKEEERQRDRY